MSCSGKSILRIMKLSIITINYNNCAGLKMTADSVLSQTSKDFEWIVIDGGSTDGSRLLIEEYQESMTYWCSEHDKGIYHAMNKGIARATGDYCLFLNSGDVLYSCDVVSWVLSHLDGTDFLVGNIYLSSNLKKNMVKKEFFTPKGVVWVMNLFGFPHQSTFVARKILEQYGGYREDMRISSDWWLCYQALMTGNATIKYLPYDIAIYDDSGISSSNKKLLKDERETLLKEKPYLHQMYSFYNDNYDIIQSIRCNSYTFLIFRIYYFIYRLFK